MLLTAWFQKNCHSAYNALSIFYNIYGPRRGWWNSWNEWTKSANHRADQKLPSNHRWAFNSQWNRRRVNQSYVTLQNKINYLRIMIEHEWTNVCYPINKKNDRLIFFVICCSVFLYCLLFMSSWTFLGNWGLVKMTLGSSKGGKGQLTHSCTLSKIRKLFSAFEKN